MFPKVIHCEFEVRVKLKRQVKMIPLLVGARKKIGPVCNTPENDWTKSMKKRSKRYTANDFKRLLLKGVKSGWEQLIFACL